MQSIRILIAEKFQLVRTAFADLLNNQKGLYVVGETNNGIELIEKYFQLKPDVVLSEIFLPLKSGTEALIEIKKKDRLVKFFFLSIFQEQKYYSQCMKMGACGCINKNISLGELLLAIRTVSEGNKYYKNNISQEAEYLHSIDDNTFFPGVDISLREREVLSLIGKGYSSVEIAEHLCIAKRTIDTHRANLARKLGARSRTELIEYAAKYSLLLD